MSILIRRAIAQEIKTKNATKCDKVEIIKQLKFTTYVWDGRDIAQKLKNIASCTIYITDSVHQ